MPANKMGSRRLHGGKVQRAVDPVAGLIIKGIIHRAAPQAVVVGFGVGGIAGVEIIRHLLRCQCPHIHGQAGVQRQRDALHRDAAIIMEVQGKPPGMHPGIGAGTALYIGPGAKHALHSILHHRTHRNPIGLHLKPRIICALVGKPEENIHGTPFELGGRSEELGVFGVRWRAHFEYQLLPYSKIAAQAAPSTPNPYFLTPN